MRQFFSLAGLVLPGVLAVVGCPPEVVAAPATQAAAVPWTTLYAETGWYTDYRQAEQVFTGILQRHEEPLVGPLGRAHCYKLGTRLLFPGKEHPELENLIDQKVEIRGKAFSVALDGKNVAEIWPAAIRGAAPLTPAGPATLPVAAASQPSGAKGGLIGRVVDKQGVAMGGATVTVYLDQGALSRPKAAEVTTKADGKFEIWVQAETNLVVNIFSPARSELWTKGGVTVKGGEKTDLGDVKMLPPKP